MRTYTYLFIVLFSIFIWVKPMVSRGSPPQANLVQLDSDIESLHIGCEDGREYSFVKAVESRIGTNSVIHKRFDSGILRPMDKHPEYFKRSGYIKVDLASLTRSLPMSNYLLMVRIRGDGDISYLSSKALKYKRYSLINRNGNYG